MGRATAHFFGPAPWGPGERPKGQLSLNIIKFQLQSQFQRFFNQTLCVFSHVSDRIFIWPPGSCPRGGTWGYRGGFGGVKKIFSQNSTRFGVGVTCMNVTCTGAIFWVPAPLGPREGPKSQLSLNLNYKVNFKYLNETLYIFSQMKDI